MREFKFEPAQLEVRAGRVELVLRNEGLIPHDLAIPALGVKTEYIAAKKAKVLVLDLKPGTYSFECTVGGHKQAGMHGTLVVR
ncbi:MAG: cupredoxin domain-containing protein [Armatimonadetes bacterium]|nr:cupredoxin domain-containing protein [Armatimonadota bacterium]